jgi:RNA polymerase sigma-70 factor (ECF subfamily)
VSQAPDQTEMTRLLTEIRSLGGADSEIRDRLFHATYDELRRLAADLMRREPREHTLRPTALVHEAYLRLIRQKDVSWEDRAHFFGIAARAMRQVLVDHARAKAARKRGGGLTRVTLDEDLGGPGSNVLQLIDLDTALGRLSKMNQRMGRVVEMKVFAGLDVAELAHLLGVSKRTVEGDWTFARVWLGRELGG